MSSKIYIDELDINNAIRSIRDMCIRIKIDAIYKKNTNISFNDLFIKLMTIGDDESLSEVISQARKVFTHYADRLDKISIIV